MFWMDEMLPSPLRRRASIPQKQGTQKNLLSNNNVHRKTKEDMAIIPGARKFKF